MSKRLSLDLRNKIETNVMKSVYGERRLALENRKKSLGDALYRKVIGEHEQTMMAMPDGYFMKSSECCITVKQKKHGETRHWLSFSVERLLPATVRLFGTPLATIDLAETNDGFAREFSAIENEEEALRNAESELKQSLRPVLESVASVKKLLEVWPEAKDFLPEDAVAETRHNLPAVVVDDLNRKIASLKVAA